MPKKTIAWNWKQFEEFSRSELYELLAARIDVFVLEQQCAYQELDGQDIDAWHLCAFKDGGLAAYLRLMPAGKRFAEPSIGRVMTVAAARGKGLGRELMIRGIAGCAHYYPGQALRVSAQAQLESFYRSLGFVADGPAYEEDGIPHLDMLLEAYSSEQ